MGRVHKGFDGPFDWGIFNHEEDLIATAWGAVEREAADARLIAAAPEMLEALEEIEALIRESSGVTGWHLNGQVAPWEELDLKVGAVLRKARGEA